MSLTLTVNKKLKAGRNLAIDIQDTTAVMNELLKILVMNLYIFYIFIYTFITKDS